MDTRSRTAASIAIAALAAVALTERAAVACSCSAPGPACHEAWYAHAVFEGTVLTIAWDQTDPAPIWQARLVTLRVERAFIGEERAGERVDVQTGSGGGDCGYTFEVGRRYLVYAGKNRLGRLVTSICSRTKAMERAAEDLSYLANIPAPRAGAEVTGRAVVVDHGAYGESTRTPIPDAVVSLEGAGRLLTTVTDANGDFRFDSVPAGTYRRRLRTELEVSPRDLEATVYVPDSRGCASDTVLAVYERNVTGRVVDRSGHPVRRRMVTLLRVDARQGFETAGYTTTDESGRFAFASVFAGRYRVLTSDPLQPHWGDPGPDARYCPGVASAGVARVLTVGPGTGEFAIGDCRVPH